MAETRVIKRYSNRKLYDTGRSRYVTLDQIAEMIRDGEDVRIVDNNSKEDLTGVTLAQIIFEEEKKKKSFLPLSAMRGIIQSGGESLSELASQAGARVRSMFGRGEASPTDEAAAEAPPEPPPVEETDAQMTKGDAKVDGGPVQVLRDLVAKSQQTFDEWQQKVDERVQKVVETLAPWTLLEKELRDLRDRLADLEKKLGETDETQ